MLARLLISVGVVAVSVGFTFFGIATSTYEFYDRAAQAGYVLMAGGTIASVAGGLMYRSAERKAGPG